MKTEVEIYNPLPVKFWRTLGEFIILGFLVELFVFGVWLGEMWIRALQKISNCWRVCWQLLIFLPQ